MKLIDEAIVANMKSVIFNGKIASRIIRADSNTDDKLLYQKLRKITLMLHRMMKLLLLKTVRLQHMTNRIVVY